MKNKLTILIGSSLILMVLLGLYALPSSPPAKEYDLKIVKIEGVWRVVDASDYTKTEVKVKKNDKIIWLLEGTDAYFQFPAKLFNPVDPGDSLGGGGYTKFVKDGKRLKLKVKDNAPAGTYEYAVFCTANGEFAEGESPPKIVVE